MNGREEGLAAGIVRAAAFITGFGDSLKTALQAQSRRRGAIPGL
jgi:hypothetical protein